MKNIIGIIIILLLGVGFLFLRQTQKPTNTNPEELSSSINPTIMLEQTQKQYSSPPPMTIDQTKKYTALLTTNKGEMTVTLFPDEAPIAVNNFIFLAKEGFYTNTPFHRVISDFMIQGGDPTGTGTGGPGYRFEDEAVMKDYTRGTLAMANAGPDTNGSQFFIMHKDSDSLPKDYVIFGSIEKNDEASLKTLDTLLATPVTRSMSGEPSKPTEDLRLLSVTITEK
jgi:cyclophilin family peptidyl-prolyl cis-trans isomerase